MESRKSAAPSSEVLGNAVANVLHVSEATTKDTKTKKTSLPAGVVLNAPSETDTTQLTASKESEKNGWDIESLFSKAEHEDRSKESEPESSEELSDVEGREVVSDYVDGRTEAVETELAETPEDSPLAAIASANQVLLEKLSAAAEASEQPPEVIIDAATRSTIEELDLERNDSEVGAAEPTSPARIKPPHPVTVRQQEVVIASILAEEEPTQEAEQPMPVSDDIVREMHGTPSVQQEVAPSATATPARKTESSPSTYANRDVAAGVLVGGVAGYMVGRRSGRKRAEAAAKPVQEKLSKEVTVLQKKIVQNEQLVRSLAANKVAKEHASTAEPQPAYAHFVSKSSEQTLAKPSKQEHGTAPMPFTQESPTLTALPVEQAPEHVAQKAADQHIAPEQKPKSHVAEISRPIVQPRQEQVHAVTSIDKMPLDDVLVIIAKRVTVEGKPLESYYKKGQLSEQAVRKILIEQRQTGRPERAFYKHITMRENHVQSHEKLAAAEARTTTAKPTDHVAHAVSSSLPPTSVHANQTAQQTSTQTSVEADPLHADNTPRIGATATIGIILIVIFAFFLMRILFS